MLTDDVREQIEVHPYLRALASWRSEWIKLARPNQLRPRGDDWDCWLINAGRGFGKTRSGAEDAGFFAASAPGMRVAVIAPTIADCRRVCFEGESGLLSVVPRQLISSYSAANPIVLELVNGSALFGYSAEKPDRLRGPQFHRAWCDELASWQRLSDTWDNLMFGLRLGTSPKSVITTTPRPLEFLRSMIKNPRCRVSTGSTFENAANLAPSAIRTFRAVYEGTRKGRQELHAEILDAVVGALWTDDLLDLVRLDPSRELPEFVRVVIAIDPAVTTADDSDETGIIAAALGFDSLVYVLEDLTLKGSPYQWARSALAAYERFGADVIVGETNNGGDLIESNLRGAADGRNFRFKKVHAKRGKLLRAEPVAAYYEKGKVRHAGKFPELESQMVKFTGSTEGKSPDRLDALVYAIGELMSGTVGHAFW